MAVKQAILHVGRKGIRLAHFHLHKSYQQEITVNNVKPPLRSVFVPNETNELDPTYDDLVVCCGKEDPDERYIGIRAHGIQHMIFISLKQAKELRPWLDDAISWMEAFSPQGKNTK